MSALSKKRVLVVEDEFLIAMMAEEMLRDLDAEPVGPAQNVAEALALIDKEEIDAVLLDANLGGQRSDAVAEALIARRVPFVIATGYGSGGWPPDYPARILDKPYTKAQVAEALERALAR